MGEPEKRRRLTEAAAAALLISRRHNLAALLTAEGRLQGGLEAALAMATGYAAGTGLGYLKSVATGTLAGFAAVILAGRRRAREAGRRRILDELRLMGVEIDTPSTLAADRRRARQTAAAFAGYWLAKGREALAEGASTAEATRFASASQAFRVRMVATTEASTAYTAERSAVARAVVPLTKGLAVVPYRVWCSAREKNTCETCYGVHGEMVLLGEHFSLGEPGDVHPRCLCYDTIEWALSSASDYSESVLLGAA